MDDGFSFTRGEEIDAYRTMLAIRRFEEKTGQLCALGVIEGACALSIGLEASVVGFAMAMGAADQVVAGERCNGHMLALGIEPRAIMAHLIGRAAGAFADPLSSMSGAVREPGFMGAHRDAEGALALASAIALANRSRGSDAACLCFLGDAGAVASGARRAHALAAAWRLPVVCVIDSYLSAPSGAEPPGGAEPVSVLPVTRRVDGMDVRAVRAAGRAALDEARTGRGPVVLEVATVPYRTHAAASAAKGGARRAPRREEADPLAKARLRLIADRVATDSELRKIESGVREWINAATAAARSGRAPARGTRKQVSA